MERPLWSKSALRNFVFQAQNEKQGSPCPKVCFLWLLDKKDSGLFPDVGANSSCVTSYRHLLAKS